MKIVCMLRVKNEEARLPEIFEEHTFVDEFVFVDNGSTDRTREILEAEPRVVDIQDTEGYHEGRDKLLLLKMVYARNPDWILWLDADEIFEKRAKHGHLRAMIHDNPNIVGWRFRKYCFWKGRTHYRVDGPWGNFPRNPGLRLVKAVPGLTMANRALHNGTFIGINKHGLVATSTLRIKHYTVENLTYAQQKYDLYTKIDPTPEKRNGYRHLISERGIQLEKWRECFS